MGFKENHRLTRTRCKPLCPGEIKTTTHVCFCSNLSRVRACFFCLSVYQSTQSTSNHALRLGPQKLLAEWIPATASSTLYPSRIYHQLWTYVIFYITSALYCLSFQTNASSKKTEVTISFVVEHFKPLVSAPKTLSVEAGWMNEWTQDRVWLFTTALAPQSLRFRSHALLTKCLFPCSLLSFCS